MKPLTEWDVKSFVKHQIRVSSSEEPLGYLFNGIRTGVPFQSLFRKEDVLSALELFEDKLIRLGNKNAGIIKVGDVFNISDECFQIKEVKGR